MKFPTYHLIWPNKATIPSAPPQKLTSLRRFITVFFYIIIRHMVWLSKIRKMPTLYKILSPLWSFHSISENVENCISPDIIMQNIPSSENITGNWLYPGSDQTRHWHRDHLHPGNAFLSSCHHPGHRNYRFGFSILMETLRKVFVHENNMLNLGKLLSLLNLIVLLN